MQLFRLLTLIALSVIPIDAALLEGINQKKPLSQTRLGKLYDSCYTGNDTALSKMFRNYASINLEQAKHCVSLALSNENPLPTIQTVKTSFPNFIPVEPYHAFSKDVFTLLYDDFIDDWIENPSNIPNDLFSNESTATLFFQSREASQFPLDFVNIALKASLTFTNLELALWAISREPTTDFIFFHLISKAEDPATFKLLFAENINLNLDNASYIEEWIIECGSLVAYDFLIKSGTLLSRDNLVTKEGQLGILCKILFSPNPTAIDFFMRFLEDSKLNTNYLLLADLFFEIDFCKILKPLNRPIFKFILSVIASDSRWNFFLTEKHHCLDTETILEFKLFNSEVETKMLVQKYLHLNLRTESKDKLQEKIRFLTKIGYGIAIVFDGSENDPVNYSIRRIDLVKIFLDLIQKTRQGETLIDCQVNEKPALFEELEALPYSLFVQFKQVYTRFPSYFFNEPSGHYELSLVSSTTMFSPEKYKLYHVADPKVLYCLMGKAARSLDHLDFETVLNFVLPMMLQLKNIGWMVEVLRFIYRNLNQTIEDWYVDSKRDKYLARRTFQGYLEIQKFAEFLVFLRTRVVQQNLEVLKEQAASIFFFSMNAMWMSRESEVLYMCRTTMDGEKNPIMLKLITWLEDRLYNRQFVSIFAETASFEALSDLLRGQASFVTNIFKVK